LGKSRFNRRWHRNANLFLGQGNRLHCRRRYAEAIQMYRRALTLAPDYLQPHISLAWSYILWQGQLDTLRAVLRGLPDAEPGGGAPRVGVEQMLVLSLERKPDSILTLLRGLRGDAWNSGESVEWRALTAAHGTGRHGGPPRVESVAVLLDWRCERGRAAAPDNTRGGLARSATDGAHQALAGTVGWCRNNHNCPGEPEVRAIILQTSNRFRAGGGRTVATTGDDNAPPRPVGPSRKNARFRPCWPGTPIRCRWRALNRCTPGCSSRPADQRHTFQRVALHAPGGPPLLFTSGLVAGERTGTFYGEQLYHASLDPAEYVLHVYEYAGGLGYGELEVGQEMVIFDSDAAQQ
jgi:hypothetical protein